MKDSIRKLSAYSFIFIAMTLLYLSSFYNYLLFHTIAEIFSVCIAFTVFLIAWNSISYLKNNYLILVGIAYLFIGFLDLFHTMGYKGMAIFSDYDYYANQLWIAARYFESIIVLLSFVFLKSKRNINPYILFGIYTIITAGIMASIFVWKIFPVCFIDGIGLTDFKKVSEYIICLILFAAIFVLNKNRDAFESNIFNYLRISMICTIISELAFTVYIDNYGLSNLVGHYFKIFSFYFIYKAIIAKGISEPHGIIFREIKLNEQKLFEQYNLLKNQVIIDGLTGLNNHRYIYERLEEEVEKSAYIKGSFVVMMIDIDHFKRINDNYGHLTGDNILKELALLLRENTRQNDLVGRYGGEEFLIMLSQTSLSQGFAVAEKIREMINQKVFIQNIHLTVSIGIAEFNGEKVSELLERADKNLYSAKKSGRNKTVM